VSLNECAGGADLALGCADISYAYCVPWRHEPRAACGLTGISEGLRYGLAGRRYAVLSDRAGLITVQK